MRGATSKKPGKRTEQSAPRPEYGRGTGVPNPIDVEVGGRIRTRRLLLGMNQQALADALDLTFQQVQQRSGNDCRPAVLRSAGASIALTSQHPPTRCADSRAFMGPETARFWSVALRLSDENRLAGGARGIPHKTDGLILHPVS